MRNIIFIVSVALCIFTPIGCSTNMHKKMVVKETLFKGNPYHLAVEFPMGTSKEDALVEDIDGRLMIVLPITEEMLSRRLQDEGKEKNFFFF